jgi:ubiquinone/menaquinone biosynthesis C-methylase UbiE
MRVLRCHTLFACLGGISLTVGKAATRHHSIHPSIHRIPASYTARAMTTHNDMIVEQFSLQAIPFSKVPGHLDSLNVLVESSGVTAAAQSNVLDVACGPGIVACEFAKHSKHVVGVDITPAMIDQAKSRQLAARLMNVSWKVVDVSKRLPFDDQTFDVVVTRYSFHHFLDPSAVLSEMIRVCKYGGRIVIADVVLPADKVAKYDALELIRDPSHVHALTHAEISALINSSGLTNIKTTYYKVAIELEQQLRASFPPNAGDVDTIRTMFADDLVEDRMGINVHKKGDEIHYEVPITVIVGDRPASEH